MADSFFGEDSSGCSLGSLFCFILKAVYGAPALFCVPLASFTEGDGVSADDGNRDGEKAAVRRPVSASCTAVGLTDRPGATEGWRVHSLRQGDTLPGRQSASAPVRG